MPDTTDNERCEHPVCACAVEPGERFCSSQCKDAVEHPHAGTHGERCLCGHPACAAGATR